MVYIELYRDPPPSNEAYDNLDCTYACWDQLRELGERFGWVPHGTIHGHPVRREEERQWRVEVEKTLRPDWRQYQKVPRPSDPKLVNKHQEERGICLRYDLYHPREFGDQRRVTPADALAWAEALERALEVSEPFKAPTSGVVLTESATAEVNRLATEGLDTAFLQEFVAYLRRGGFLFSWGW